MTTSGSIRGRYGPSPYITNHVRRRLDAPVSGEIENPAFCLYKGDSMMFDIPSAEHYPVYLKDSLLNTNANFDFSLFTDLSLRLQSGEDIEVFAFTFSNAGTYVFGDAVDNSNQMVVAIMEINQKCPDDDKFLQPITT